MRESQALGIYTVTDSTVLVNHIYSLHQASPTIGWHEMLAGRNRRPGSREGVSHHLIWIMKCKGPWEHKHLTLSCLRTDGSPSRETDCLLPQEEVVAWHMCQAMAYQNMSLNWTAERLHRTVGGVQSLQTGVVVEVWGKTCGLFSVIVWVLPALGPQLWKINPNT
jgi:hypothetical protein